MNTTNARNRRFPTFLLAAALGATAAGPVLLATPAARAADDWYKDVRPDRLPEPVRVALENDAAGSSDLRFYEVRPHVFAVRYTKPYGLRMETKVNDEGQILGRGETNVQPNLKGREQLEAARAAFAREEAERQAARDAAVRAQGEHEARERLRAEKEAEREALYQQHLQDIQRLEAEARRQKAIGDARRMSEEWNADRIFPAWRDQLPDDVRRTFDRQTGGATGIRYYSYIVGDQTYYSAHFTAADGHRAEVRVDPGGQLLGRRDVTTTEEDRFLDRERWVRDQWRPHDEHRDEHHEEHVVVVPPQPVPAVANGRAVKINSDEAPAAVRETMRREARNGQYVEFYRVDVPGRNNDQFIVGYTDAAGRRIHVQLNRDGQILERRELIEGHERPLR